MAIMDMLFGFGGVRFDNGLDVIDFDYGRGIILPVPIFSKRRENIDRMIITRQLGFRNNITIELYSRSDADVAKFRNLAVMINSLTDDTEQQTMEVYPRYDSTAEINQSYEVILNSNFSVTDLANVPVGQKIELSFIAIELDGISTVTSDSSLSNWVDESDNRLVDESGNYLILKND